MINKSYNFRITVGEGKREGVGERKAEWDGRKMKRKVLNKMHIACVQMYNVQLSFIHRIIPVSNYMHAF